MFLAEAYPLDDYIKVHDNEINFPKELNVAFAVCSKECGNTEFLVDGSSQVCQYCGRLMFRTLTKKYTLAE